MFFEIVVKFLLNVRQAFTCGDAVSIHGDVLRNEPKQNWQTREQHIDARRQRFFTKGQNGSGNHREVLKVLPNGLINIFIALCSLLILNLPKFQPLFVVRGNHDIPKDTKRESQSFRHEKNESLFVTARYSSVL